MAKTAMKKRAAENSKTLSTYNSIIITVVYILWKVWWNADSWTGWNWAGLGLLGVIYYAIYYKFMYGRGRPIVNKETGEIEDEGIDLNQSGITEYYWDLIYIAIFTQVSTLFSDWFWLTFLVVPGYAIYELMSRVVLPWIFKPDAEETETAKQKKRRERKERGKVKCLR